MPQPSAKLLCIYHGNCADGLLAAWAVHRAGFAQGVEFIPVSYGETPYLDGTFKDISYLGRDVLIVDFSFPLESVRAMAAEARSVLVLDHHKTAREDLSGLEPPIELDSYLDKRSGYLGWVSWLLEQQGTELHAEENLAAIFDLERSGAALSWDYLHPGSPRPRIIDLVEDRDLWRFAFGDESRAFHAVLTSYDMANLPAMFQRLNTWYMHGEGSNFWNKLLDEGYAILRAQRQAVATAVAARAAGFDAPLGWEGEGN